MQQKAAGTKVITSKVSCFIQDVRVIYEHENMNQPQVVPLNIFV